MRNMKKFLALVLAMLMVFSMAVISTSAADEADYTEAAHHLAALGVLKGDGKDLLLENGVTRWQAALFFVQALTGKTDAKLWNADKSVYFSDVPEYGTAIDYAYGMNLIVGRGDGTYGYHDAITYQDMLVLAVRALGYETPDMVYPQGYINAATKLGLTDNIAVDVSFKDALTRGETSQIIWDMLGTEVAYTDPLSGKLVYPGEEGLLEALLEKEIDRTTLLKESGFADAEIVATIVEFTEADEDDDESVATVKVAYTYVDDNDVETEVEMLVDAADLDITEDTPKVNYLGKEVTLYVDCAVKDFEAKYEDDKAEVVFADYNEYTTVENLGDEGNIKVVLKNNNPTDANTYVSLDGVKFKNSKYYVDLKTWQVAEDDGTYTIGWNAISNDSENVYPTFSDAFGSFVYDDGEYVGATNNPFAAFVNVYNTYGKVEYRVTDTTVFVKDNQVVAEGTDGAVKKVVVEVLYTPYKFGQYNVFTTKDSTTSKDADFAAYTDGFSTTNRLFGSNTVITKNTASVSATNGAAAKSVVMAGEAVESGDFMFYDYNECDNILTVAQNCGTFNNGRLTSQNDKKETVKINGSNYKFGFKGQFTTTNLAYDDVEAAIEIRYIDKLKDLEAGENNVKYLAVDGRIVYLGTPDADTTSSAGAFDFVIATTDAEVVADLLEMEVEDYEDALVSGVYVEDGYVVIAVLDLTTGEWELGYLDTLAVSYNAAKEKFTNAADVASLATFADIGKLADDKAPLFKAAKEALLGRVFALISEDDGVYDLGVATNYGAVSAEAPAVVAKPAGWDDLTDVQIAGIVPATPVVENPGDAPAVVAKPDGWDNLTEQQIAGIVAATPVVENPGDAPAVVADPGDAPVVVAKPGAEPLRSEFGPYADYLAAHDTWVANKAAHNAYVVAKAEYDAKLAAYNAYVVAKAQYDLDKAAYDAYKAANANYEYKTYLAAQEAWTAKDTAYKAYVKANAPYAYKTYLAELAAYNALVAANTANTNFFAPFATAPNTNGITFSTAGRTNALTIPGSYDADANEWDTTRITTGDASVVVVVTADGKVAVRAGKTATADTTYVYTVNAGDNTLLSVSEELIVLVHSKTSVVGQALEKLEVSEWSNVGNKVATTEYYLSLPGTEFDFDYNEDDEKEWTISGVWSWNTKALTTIVTTDEAIVDILSVPGNIVNTNGKGKLVDWNKKTSDGKYNYTGDDISGIMVGFHLGNYARVASSCANTAGTTPFGNKFQFIDHETLAIKGGLREWKTLYATKVNGFALNFNLSSVDPEEYDFTRMILKDSITTDSDALYAEYAKYAKYGVDIIKVGKNASGVMQYAVTFPFEAEGNHTFSEPTEGVFNQFMIDHAGSELFVPSVDAESDMDYSDAATVKFTNATNADGAIDANKRVDLKIAVANKLVDAE